MHELALSRAIAEAAERHAEGYPVMSIELRIGRLRQVVPETLEFYFEFAARGTLCEGARLQLTVLPVRARCGACGVEWEPDRALFRCPGCSGAKVDILGGNEFEIEAIVIDDGAVPGGRAGTRTAATPGGGTAAEPAPPAVDGPRGD